MSNAFFRSVGQKVAFSGVMVITATAITSSIIFRSTNHMKCGRPASASLYSSVACGSRAKQVQSRAAALVNGERRFRADYLEIEKPVQDQHGDTSGRASYSDELMAAFKRKTQELCDETRERCEQRLERQEAQHERQVQSLQRQLRDVVGSCVSLAEHEQILATTAQEQQCQLEEIRRRHHLEMHEFEQRCNQKWQAKMVAFKTQSEQEKSQLTQRIEQLELQQNEAAAEAKERELAELRWSEQLEAAAREKAEVEKRIDDAKTRLEDACRIIVALKTRLRHHKRLARDLELQRDKNSATRDEVVQCKLAYAELKGDMDTRVATLERDLDHALRAVADEKANACALQSEVAGLRDQLQRQQCAAADLSAKGALSSEHHASERKQLQKEVAGLQRALQQEKQSVKEAVARMDEMQQRAAEAQLQHQTLVQDMRTRLELQQATEASLKRQGQRLRQRMEQFKAVAEKLHAENKQLGEEVHNRDASTEAWARKLFGGK